MARGIIDFSVVANADSYLMASGREDQEGYLLDLEDLSSALDFADDCVLVRFFVRDPNAGKKAPRGRGEPGFLVQLELRGGVELGPGPADEGVQFSLGGSPDGRVEALMTRQDTSVRVVADECALKACTEMWRQHEG